MREKIGFGVRFFVDYALLEAEEPDSVCIVVRMLFDRGRGTVRQDRLSFDVWRLKPAFDIRRL